MDDPLPVLAPDSDSFFNSSLFFNASRQLAHRFFTLPSRAIALLRKLDHMPAGIDFHEAPNASPSPTSNAQSASSGSQGYRRHRHMGAASTAPPMPGPWGFLTSGYFVGLFIMAFLLNRIQNIVVPPRRPLAFRLNQSNFELHHRRPLSLHRLLLSMFFPVDFSSSVSKFAFRVPSLYFLAKSITLWIVLLIQTQDSTFFTRVSWLGPIGDWVASKTMEDICWYTFMSTCLTLCIGTLTTGLEGLNINDNAPFNLFAFAFQLYVESASHLASPKAGEAPSRPNPHVVITILLPLCHLTMMHFLEIKHKWSQHRLLISAVGGFFAVLHFHYVVWFCTTPYPLTTYAARIVETTMLSIISVTVGLNVITQLLAEGTISRPVFGHAALLPRRDEDFNVALFRLGTASMEATAVAGFGNEVGGVSSVRQRDIALAHQREVVRGELEIDRTGVSGLSPAYEQRGPRRIVKKGFANEITNVKVKAASTDFWMNTVLNVAWQRHLVTFLLSVWRAVRRLWTAAAAKVRRKAGVRERSPSVVLLDRPPSWMRAGSEDDADPYERFLRGETVSDDEEEFQPTEERLPEAESTDDEAEVDGQDEDVEEDAEQSGEQAQLYADLSSDVTSAPLLLAHMATPASSPLTRRGYRRLVSQPQRPSADPGDWDDFVHELRQSKRSAVPDEDSNSENTRACVICTVEPRDIICWPCRCLALCDDCRNNLASRSSASKHTCPCCRRNVEGYSKIYIP